MNTYRCTKCGSPCFKSPCGDTAGLGHWTCPKCGHGAKVRRVKDEGKDRHSA